MKDKRTKREEAEIRNEAYQNLSTAEKIQLAKSRPGNSAREIARLTKKESK